MPTDAEIEEAACASASVWMANKNCGDLSSEQIRERWESWDFAFKRPWIDQARAAYAVFERQRGSAHSAGLRRAAEIVGYLLESGEMSQASIIEAINTIMLEAEPVSAPGHTDLMISPEAIDQALREDEIERLRGDLSKATTTLQLIALRGGYNDTAEEYGKLAERTLAEIASAPPAPKEGE